jgi:hypothetical protein
MSTQLRIDRILSLIDHVLDEDTQAGRPPLDDEVRDDGEVLHAQAA